ncbi:putative beta-galactosidase [Rosa chinensis]|uniref:Putative beta-galactosidase n=1 Tax=Rosa chinensis TaxID=74649 RepID=A0A2P6PDU8_ROSCH|nr:putative beta-galactosidase [Rosa chinensis]
MAHVFSSKPGGCAAFLSNCNAISAATVTFNDRNCEIPACSNSVLPDCENVVFNTAKLCSVMIRSTYGTLQDQRFTFTGDVNMHAGVNKILLLSVAVGLPVSYCDVKGPVVQQGLDQGSRDLSGQIWSYKVGLNGESMNLGSPTSTFAVNWTRVYHVPQSWLKPSQNLLVVLRSLLAMLQRLIF